MKHKYDDIDIEYIKNRINPRTGALKVALIYGLVVGVSLFFLNRFMVLALDDMKIGHKITLIKDEIFVTITMLILYMIVRRQMTLLKKSVDKVYDGYRELDIANRQLSATKELLKENFETLNQHQDEQIKLQERLWHQRNLSKSIINDVGAIILMWYPDGSMNIFNPFAEEITGYKASEVLGKRWIDILIPLEDREYMQSVFDRILESDFLRHENRIICKDGGMMDILWSNSILRDKDGNISEIISIGTDITERKEMEKRLHMMAYYDTLTGLPNRIMIEEKFDKLLSGHNDDGFRAAIMILDIDNFKNINETLGHNVGDMLLKNVANVLKKYIKSPNMLGRISGDGFIVVLNNMQNVTDIIGRVMDVQQYLKRTWYADGREIFVSTSVGIALYPDHGKDASILIKNASTAMFYVKERSKDDYAFYIKDMEKNAFERMEMLNMLCSAVEKREFSLYYQPQVDIKTGKIVGAEALIRW
ncbi:diguanylate cyclase domain-containing protein, partial [Xylanivirga thermophila]|uniref:diguanylate cyclase domain-containing protein n=1 Tax=Xylanivirga thermophila TaxID=2496273 RepID=UPI0039F51E0B